MKDISTTKALYLHVPFCKTICHYCDFTHVVYQTKLVEDWLNAVAIELASKPISSLKTIYIGGGTPSVLTPNQLERLLQLLSKYSKNVEEYTIEINPETFDLTKAELLVKYGVNRASVGLQTSNDQLLKMMNRNHCFQDVIDTVTTLQRVGIDNISLDIMYSLPNQTIQDLKQSIDDALSLNIKHISIYSLTIEPNTVFFKRKIEHLDDEVEADMYDFICSYLPQHHFQQYEISNFCLDGYASKHNQVYWRYDDYFGISSGASGKENGVRYDKPKNVIRYIQDPLFKTVIEESEEEQMFEWLMMGLRLKQGVDIHDFETKFNQPLFSVYQETLNHHIQQGLLQLQGSILSCSEKGYPLLNEILLDYLK